MFQKKDGAYQVGVVGKLPLDPKDVDELLRTADAATGLDIDVDNAIVPTKPVSVGERWAIDPKAVKAYFKSFDSNQMKVTRAEAKLLKVYPKGKSRFGVLEVNFELAVMSLGPGIKFDVPATQKMKWTIDTAIDGSSTARTEIGTYELKGAAIIREGEKTIRVEGDSHISGRYERSEERDDPKAREVPAVEFIGPGGWIDFTSKEGRFTASFPGKPTVTQEDHKNGHVMTGVMSTRENDNIFYMVMFRDYAKLNAKADTKTHFKTIVDSLAKVSRERKDIVHDGYPGVEFVSDLEKNGVRVFMTHQVFFVNGRLYQLMAGSTPSVREKLEVRRFLDSFRLHDAKDGMEAGRGRGR